MSNVINLTPSKKRTSLRDLNERIFLSVAEAGKLLGIAESTVRYYIEHYDLPVRKMRFGERVRYRIHRGDLLAWAETFGLEEIKRGA